MFNMRIIRTRYGFFRTVLSVRVCAVGKYPVRLPIINTSSSPLVDLMIKVTPITAKPKKIEVQFAKCVKCDMERGFCV